MLKAHVLLLATALATLGLAGCGGGAASASSSLPIAAQPVLLSAEDVLVVQASATTAGPLITGSLQPAKRADLRAEVSAVVTAVLKENGDAVRKGDLLVRLDDTAIRDALMSAQESERAAQLAADQAERQLTRLKTLRESGMASAQALEDAEIRRNTTHSEVASAKARVVQARQQLQRTEVRAPFDGVVADRKLSVGDTAQVGKELLKVMDPGSLRFEGLISSDAIASVQRGQKVVFRVNGFTAREFTGTVARVAPSANAMTRQVEVLVDVDEPPARVAGLYAEGRVAASNGSAIVLPASSVVREGDKTSAWRVGGGKLQKVPLALGQRDPRSGDFVVAGGLAAGDRVLRHPVATLKDGQPVSEK
ncbi:efflux RND transporter periplasmic adaptor subunit [Ramlibacter albus]|uniref:Efflux RND transporter periplasmic adaptor subunit n=1 Tax=Ramlibacter albus TaxID=2079448 RepID=A0A923S0L2_9BURK|nr:efflux RND transporter periplasmic adaptor subunit [Ramlibacter albus]MBC5763326.1 efflux RND transporter periplasmic adaptor subunit [Ramlibacter albus]